MPIEISWYEKLVKFTSPTTTVTLQEIHDFVEDERTMASPVGLSWPEIFPLIEGKVEDPNAPGVLSQIILTLNDEWQMQFWGGSGYTEISGGKLQGGLNGQVMKATGTAGDITVLKSQVDGVYVVAGSTTDELTVLRKMVYNKATLSGDTLTIYEDDELTVWKQFDLSSGGRVEI